MPNLSNDPLENIVASQPTGQPSKFSEAAPELIWSYLCYHGYGEAASKFLRDWQGGEPKLHTRHQLSYRTLSIRSTVSRLLADGDICGCLAYLEEQLPELLNHSLDIRFALLRQHFVELVRLGKPTEALEWAESRLAPIVGKQPAFANSLHEVIALLAYSDPSTSPLQPLLDPIHRLHLSSRINQAILGERESNLETTLRQVIVLRELSSEQQQQQQSERKASVRFPEVM